MKIFYFAGYFFLLKCVGAAFFGTVFVTSMILSHKTTKLPMTFLKYF